MCVCVGGGALMDRNDNLWTELAHSIFMAGIISLSPLQVITISRR